MTITINLPPAAEEQLRAQAAATGKNISTLVVEVEWAPAGSQARKGKATVVTASVPESLVARLDELAGQRGWNRSRAVTEAIRRLVKAKR